MKTILVVEDTEAVKNEISDILQIEGYNVITAIDGIRGLSVIKTQKPDLIITDILMPNLDGYEFVEKLNKMEDTKNIPKVFLTAKAEKFNKQIANALGVTDYLVKPLSIIKLLEVVKKKLSN